MMPICLHCQKPVELDATGEEWIHAVNPDHEVSDVRRMYACNGRNNRTYAALMTHHHAFIRNMMREATR